MNSKNARTVSLVLGAGGARGLAHIGVIDALEDAGYTINCVSGSSMGALIGGIYAMGKLSEYHEWVTGLKQSEIFGLLDWTLSGGGLIQGHKLISHLRNLVGDANIEDLPVAFTAVAVDIDHGREVWFSDGPLFDAIRATIAIPGIFTPHRYKGRTLVDGGLLNPVPVAPTLRTLSDLTIVVNVNGPDSDQLLERTDVSSNDGEEQNGGILSRIRDYIDSFSKDKSPENSSPGLIAVLVRSLETMESVIARQQLAVFRPDLVIEIPRNACMIHEFHMASEMIELGRTLAKRTLAD